MSRLTHLLALGLALVPTLSAAQSCGADAEIFEVHQIGIYPNKVYHDDDTPVCFRNDSNNRFWLVYKNEAGREVYTNWLDYGATSTPLVTPGNDVEIFPVVNLAEGTRTVSYQCGTRTVERQRRVCRSWHWYYGYYDCYWQTYTTEEPQYCERQEEYMSYDRITSIAPARLYEGEPPLSY